MLPVTIVTICFNEEKNITRTIESVLKQSAVDFEYVICDGLSKDHTVEIAKTYEDAFAKRGISYRIFSEKDKGIYDAMNKGIDHANGRYIYFLNAGDWFCDGNVIDRFVISICEDDTPAVIYADYYHVDQHRASRMICDEALLSKRMSIGHPAMVARTDLMRAERFDVTYQIAADYNFVLGLKVRGMKFKHLDFPATYFLANGISSTNTEKTNEELRRILESHGLPYDAVVDHPVSRRQKIIGTIVNAAPTWLWRFWTEKIKHKPWIEY